MATYHVDEMSFAVPDGWIDRSVHLFSRPEGAISFNITRDDLKGEAIGPYVARQLKALAPKLPRFLVIGQRSRTVGTLQGYEARMQWAPQGSLFYQHQVYAPYYGTALIFTVTGPKQLAAQCDAHLEKSIANIKFRKQ
jgi:hypothetical protein